MIEAIQELQGDGVDPDLWKVEGLARREDCERVVTTARAGGRNNVSCIVLGRGEDDRKVREWLGIAAGVPGFVGFAIGRTVFWDPLVAWRSKLATHDQTVAEIGRRYRQFVNLFERKDASLSSVDPASTTPEHRSTMEG
jgi:myo-inositol catabolism protein IolC